jgi:translocation and assembly module TamA
LAALALAACLAKPPAHMPDAPMVDQVKVEGTRAVPAAEVKRKIVTTASSWLPAWVPFFGDAQWFDENAWQADLRRIERLYQSKGYYQARVIEDEVKTLKPGHVAVRVKVLEGEPARLSRVEVRGLEALDAAHRKQVLKDFPL